MCEQATFVWVRRGPAYEKQPVACRQCSQCKNHRVNDLIGRALAEAWASEWSLTYTLTYRDREDLAEKILTPRHFQDFIRSMRKRGHCLRYICAGEYGDLKGRAHFHAILFGKGVPPDVALETRAHVPEWPHGHVYVERVADYRTIRYVCKYVLKAETGQSWFTLSKKPPIGDAFFAMLAAREVEAGTLPSSFRYVPPNGTPDFQCTMTGATRREYLRRIIDGMGGKLLASRMSEMGAASYEKVLRWEANRDTRAKPDAAFLETFLSEVLRGKKDHLLYVAPVFDGVLSVEDKFVVSREELAQMRGRNLNVRPS